MSKFRVILGSDKDNGGWYLGLLWDKSLYEAPLI